VGGVHSLLEGTQTQDFRPLVFFHQTTPLFEYGFEIAKKIGCEIANFSHSCVVDTAVTKIDP
jgi:hypothetical protein